MKIELLIMISVLYVSNLVSVDAMLYQERRVLIHSCAVPSLKSNDRQFDQSSQLQQEVKSENQLEEQCRLWRDAMTDYPPVRRFIAAPLYAAMEYHRLQCWRFKKN